MTLSCTGGTHKKMLRPDWVKKNTLETKFTLSEEVKKKCFQVTTAGISVFVIHPASVNPDTVDTTHGTSPQDTKETNPGTAS